MERGSHTFAEIISQPAAWRQALELRDDYLSRFAALLREDRFTRIILTGCGSTYFLAVTAASQFRTVANLLAEAYPASELMLFPNAYFHAAEPTLLICVSRSGETRETLEAAQAFRERGTGKIIAITCHSESPLAQAADLVIAVDHAREVSRVQTRSFSTMAVVLTTLAASLAASPTMSGIVSLPQRLERLLTGYQDHVRRLGQDMDINQVAFLGSGPLYGLANEAMLKTTEMSRVFSTAYHVLEFLHGPQYPIDHRSLVVGLIGSESAAEEMSALRRLEPRGPKLLLISANSLEPLKYEGGTQVVLESDLPTWAGAILYLPLLQLLGFHQAIARGYNPDDLHAGPVDPSGLTRPATG